MSEIYAGATKMTADVCPTDYFCNQCGSDRKDKKHISIWSGLPCDNQWHDEPAPREPKSLLREPSKPPGKTGVEFVDRLADQWGTRQSAALRGDMTGIKNADMWLGIIAREYWSEIIASLRKTHAPTHAAPVSATSIEPVALRHFTGSSTIATEYHDVTPAVLEGKVWEIDSAWERLYSQQSMDNLLRELAEAKDQTLRTLRGNFGQMCACCGWESKGGGGSWDDLQEHIRTCKAHPLCQAIERAESAESRAAELQKKLDEAQKAMEALRDDMLNKVMAATDDQIEAAIRLEGRDPKDVAALTKQALTNALHTVEMDKLKKQLAAETKRADQNWNCAITYVSAYGIIINKQELGLNEKQRELIASLKVPQ